MQQHSLNIFEGPYKKLLSTTINHDFQFFKEKNDSEVCN